MKQLNIQDQSTSDFIDGQKMARDGVNLPANANESVIMGFSFEYALMEMKSNDQVFCWSKDWASNNTSH